MVKSYLSFFLMNVFVVLFLFTSCVNQEYDLSKGIDLNIHVGGSGLSLPVGSTDYIKLNKIIKVDESDVLHLSGGEYSLLKEDVINPVTVSVNSVAPINITPIPFPSVLLYSANAASLLKRTSGSFDVNVSFTPSNFKLEHTGIPTALKSIKKIFVPSPVTAVLMFSITGVNSDANLQFNNFKLTFPDFVVSDQLNANHELILNERLISGGIKVINIDGFDFSNEEGGALTIKDHLLKLEKEISFSGRITGSNLDGSKITDDVMLETSIRINPATISEVEGKIDPLINVKIDPVFLDIPEFLKDDAVNLDIENPMIHLNVANETNIPIIIDGLMKGYRNGNLLNQVAIESTTPIKIDANGKTSICLSRTGQGSPVGSKNYQIADLNKLIEKIPDEIQFTMNANADQNVMHKIQLGKNYNVGIDYAVEVPFRFGPGLSIVYNDTIDGFNDDIKDLDVKNLKVTMTVENSIPLILQLQATPVGLDKKVLSDIEAKVTGDINSCDKNGIVQNSPLTIELTEKNSGAIKMLDGILLKVTAKSTATVNGMPLREDQYIRLMNIKANVSGGLNVNLNNK